MFFKRLPHLSLSKHDASAVLDLLQMGKRERTMSTKKMIEAIFDRHLVQHPERLGVLHVISI